MPRVLIVEDETVLRASMVRALVKLPAEVAEAGTLAEAVAQLDRAIPDVIVSDLDLPDGSGIELIGELGRRKVRVPMLFVSAYLRAFRAQIPPHADVEVREKPLALDELRALVRERIGERPEAPAPFGVPDYLQLACLGKHSVVIEVVGRPPHRGRIEVVKGDIWHATDDVGAGLDAFKRLTFGGPAEVTCRTLMTRPGPRTIEGKWEALLMDSAREHDEQSWSGSEPVIADFELAISEFDEAAEPWPPPELAPRPASVPPKPPADQFATGSVPTLEKIISDEFTSARDRAIDALLARDYPVAAELFAVAHTLRPDDRAVAANVERLAAMGHTGKRATQEDHDA